LKAIVYQVKRQNIGHMKEQIRDACVPVTPDVLKRVHHEWERDIHMRFHCNGAIYSMFYK
jgi:hypothetical protein